MDLLIDRRWKKETYTISNLYVNGEFFCNTLEDTDRGLSSDMSLDDIKNKKNYGETAIPTGRYRITLGIKSPKYSKVEKYKKIDGYLPRLIDVPGYSGILIHIGNYPKDTNGCILVGKNTVKGAVMYSTKYFWELYYKLKEAEDNGEEIWITII